MGNENGRFSLEGLGSAVAAGSLFSGAALYFLGQTHQRASLGQFGITGSVKLDPFDVMIRGIDLIPEFLLGFLICTIGSLAVIGLTARSNLAAEVRRNLGIMLGGSVVAALPVVSWLVTLQASYDNLDVSMRAGRCTPCLLYETREESFMGSPLDGDKDRVLVLQPDGSVAVINWSDVLTVRAALIEETRRPINAGAKASAHRSIEAATQPADKQ